MEELEVPPSCADEWPCSAGVYRLYLGAQLLHVGMAAGAVTLRSELLRHARGEYGGLTQQADRVEWEVAPDAVLAYQRFVALCEAASYKASGAGPDEALAPSTSRRYG